MTSKTRSASAWVAADSTAPPNRTRVLWWPVRPKGALSIPISHLPYALMIRPFLDQFARPGRPSGLLAPAGPIVTSSGHPGPPLTGRRSSQPGQDLGRREVTTVYRDRGAPRVRLRRGRDGDHADNGGHAPEHFAQLPGP